MDNYSTIYLERLSKVTTEQIADVYDELNLNSSHVINCENKFITLNCCNQIYGRAFTVTFADVNHKQPAIFKNTRDYLDKVPSNSIIIINNISEDNQYSTWGNILSKFATKKGIKGTITNGYIRDADEINTYPIFCTGFCCSRGNKRYKVIDIGNPVTIFGKEIRQDDYIVASKSGIVIINQSTIRSILEKAEEIKQKETKILKLIDDGKSLKEIDEIISK